MAGKRPGGLTAVCVVAIVLSCLTTCATCWGYIGSAAAPALQQWQQDQMGQMGAGSPEFDRIQQIQAEMLAEQQWLMIPAMVVNTVGMVIALVLLVAAGMTLSGRSLGLKLMTPALLVAIGFEVLSAAFGVWVQIRTTEVTERYMARIMEASRVPGQPAPPPAVDALMNSTVGAAMVMGICLAAGWALAKIVYYGWSFAYLRKPEVQTLFATGQASGVAGREA
jgi:hypothetical protein